MSDLSHMEKLKFERLLDMGGGYVLNFSNRTFAEFILETTGRRIYDAQYEYLSGSKAKLMRRFWAIEANATVGKLMGAVLNYGVEIGSFAKDSPLLEECRRIVVRLVESGPVTDLDVLTAIDEGDFDAGAKAVRESVDSNQPEAGLDRLHTFVIKYVRTLCIRQGVTVTREKPLHSAFGEYVKTLRDTGLVESEMTLRILKSSISTLEAFNYVRNDQSLAHDNPILNYDEALLIFNHVASSIRFLKNLERKIAQKQSSKPKDQTGGIPF